MVRGGEHVANSRLGSLDPGSDIPYQLVKLRLVASLSSWDWQQILMRAFGNAHQARLCS